MSAQKVVLRETHESSTDRFRFARRIRSRRCERFDPAHCGRASDDALTKAARARFQEGVEAFDKGNYEAARASFKQAYALRQHPAVLLNLAQSCLKSGHYLEAAKCFSSI